MAESGEIAFSSFKVAFCQFCHNLLDIKISKGDGSPAGAKLIGECSICAVGPQPIGNSTCTFNPKSKDETTFTANVKFDPTLLHSREFACDTCKLNGAPLSDSYKIQYGHDGLCKWYCYGCSKVLFPVALE
jgi:hypothetical protein